MDYFCQAPLASQDYLRAVSAKSAAAFSRVRGAGSLHGASAVIMPILLVCMRLDDVPFSASRGMIIAKCLWRSNDHGGVEVCRVVTEEPWAHILSETRPRVTSLVSSQGRRGRKK